jgi:hypothetical protein
MSEITLIGIDLAKNIFRINCLDENGKRVMNKNLHREGELHISPESLCRFKSQIRFLTRRNQGKAFEQVIERLNRYLTGWFAYYRYGCRPSLLKRLDEWIRRSGRHA